MDAAKNKTHALMNGKRMSGRLVISKGFVVLHQSLQAASNARAEAGKIRGTKRDLIEEGNWGKQRRR